MFANEISVIANVIPRASASWEISLEYDGNPPVAKPTTRPLATIVGKLRHGRNTRVREGPAWKSLPNQTREERPSLRASAAPRSRVDGKLRPATEFRSRPFPEPSQSRMIFGRKRFNERVDESCIILHAPSPAQGFRRRCIHRCHDV